MKKKNLKRNQKSFEDESNFSSGKNSAPKNKGTKRRLSIYDDYEEDDDEFISYEKFKRRNK